MLLLIEYFKKTTTKRMVVWFSLVESVNEIGFNSNYIEEAELRSYKAMALFHLFAEGNRIVAGDPHAYYIELPQREEKVFKMLCRATVKEDWMWRHIVQEKKEKILQELEDKLPLQLLTDKIEG